VFVILEIMMIHVRESLIGIRLYSNRNYPSSTENVVVCLISILISKNKVKFTYPHLDLVICSINPEIKYLNFETKRKKTVALGKKYPERYCRSVNIHSSHHHIIICLFCCFGHLHMCLMCC
jgi:hypothetical protein